MTSQESEPVKALKVEADDDDHNVDGVVVRQLKDELSRRVRSLVSRFPKTMEIRIGNTRIDLTPLKYSNLDVFTIRYGPDKIPIYRESFRGHSLWLAEANMDRPFVLRALKDTVDELRAYMVLDDLANT